MKILIAGASLAIAAVVALTNGGEEAAYSQNSEFQQGMHSMDSVLDGALNDETHDELAAQADSSAHWVRSLAVKVQNVAE